MSEIEDIRLEYIRDDYMMEKKFEEPVVDYSDCFWDIIDDEKFDEEEDE